MTTKSHLNIEPPELVATKKYQITFEWPNGDWTWIDRDLFDYHEAMLVALRACPRECRVHNIQRL
jgi:hypothetical protein